MQDTAELRAVCFFAPKQYMVSGNIGINKVKRIYSAVYATDIIC